MFHNIKRFFFHLFNNPRQLFDILWCKSGAIIPDRLFLKVHFYNKMGYFLDLDNPHTFNEKLQWLKLYDRKDVYTTMVDKYEAKKYVESIIGPEHIVPTLGVWDKPEDIDFDSLPDQFVLKVTHDSGGLVICRDKAKLDKAAAIEKMRKGLRRNYFNQNREWPYKNVKRRIIAEKYLGENLQDYRVYCFNGEPKMIYSYTNVSEEDGSKPEPTYCDIMSPEWEKMPFRQMCPPRGGVERPANLDEMINIAKKLSEKIPFLRVDFYECNGLQIGELTFYPGSGMSRFIPSEWDGKLGDWLILPGSVLNTPETGGGKFD